MIDTPRYIRQMMLHEIGRTGQARICAATARISGAGLSHEVAERYARGAGFHAVEPGAIDIDVLAPDEIIKDPAARAVLAGARAACREISRALKAPEP